VFQLSFRLVPRPWPYLRSGSRAPAFDASESLAGIPVPWPVYAGNCHDRYTWSAAWDAANPWRHGMSGLPLLSNTKTAMAISPLI
jgi:hypothetical protein